MIGWILNTTDSLAKRFVRGRVAKTLSYKELRWSIPEKCIVRAATYPVITVLVMSVGVFIFLYAGSILELPVKKHLSPYFPYRHSITDWQTTLLGGQLTIIGIVYPLVVGLVSVVFQRKADRKIAQKAYQSYSGFMLAGLSGLFLSGFILVGVVIKMASSDYIYGLVCLVSLMWLFINIVLSIWFFIVSLEMLDDQKRQSVIKRYIAFVVVEPYVIGKISQILRVYPVYPEQKFSNLNIKQTGDVGKYILITSNYPRHENINILHRHFSFILSLINRVLIKRGVQGELVILNGGLAVEPGEKQVLFGVRHISEKNMLVRALRFCFCKSKVRRSTDSVNLTLEALTADTYLSLSESDLKVFENAIYTLSDDVAKICNLFGFDDSGRVNNFLLLTTEFMERSFLTSYSDEVCKIAKYAIEKLVDSERYYELCMWSNICLFNQREYFSLNELDISTGIMRSHWSTLTTWCSNNSPLPSATLRARYNRLTNTFAAVWERYQDNIMYRFAGEEHAVLYEHFCSKQLQDLPAMVLDAIQTRDKVSADVAVDLINRWLHSMKIEVHYTENYRYNGQFFSPGLFHERKLKSFTDRMWFNTAMMNAVTDMRICICLYLTSRMKGPDEFITYYVKLILSGSLTDDTGGFETLSEEIKEGEPLVRALVRICLWTWSEKMEHDAWLNALARRLRDYDKPDMVSGRIYGGVYDNGFIDMTGAWVQLLLMMSKEKIRISQSLKEAVAEDYLSYREKERLMRVFTRIKNQVSKEEPAYHLKDDMAVNARENLSEAMSDYVEIIDSNLKMKIRDAVVDAERLTEVARKTTEYLRQRIHKPLPLSLFKQTIEIKEDVKLTDGMVSINIDKESFAEGIEPLSILNEGDIQAEAVVESIQRMVFRKLLQAEVHKTIAADGFNMLINEIVSSPDLAEKMCLS